VTNKTDLQQLSANRLFAGVSIDAMGAFGEAVERLDCAPGDIIFREGEPGNCLYLVLDGSVCISKTGRGGQQETLGFINQGDFFGEMALIDGQPRSAQASAAEKATLGRMDAEAFSRILAASPQTLPTNFLRAVVGRLRGLNAHFIEELMRAERLALVGSMANRIIHDLRNPLQVLQSCCQLIEMKSSDPAIHSLVSMMEKANANLLNMVQEILEFARGRSSLDFCRRAPRAIIDELDSYLPRAIPQNIHITRDIHFCDDIRVDLGRFVRVLLNLIKNAVEAMPGGGVLRLGLRQQEGRAVFLIGDTGGGIPEHLLPKIYEPFVTHGKAGGTGLGLAIVKSVVDSHEGTIDIRSRTGIGTNIEISLPVLPPETVGEEDPPATIH
jgi:signal transduction histidine kinase